MTRALVPSAPKNMMHKRMPSERAAAVDDFWEKDDAKIPAAPQVRATRKRPPTAVNIGAVSSLP